MIKLTVLGSGTCVPSLKRNAPGYLLEAGGLQALVDCGSGTLLQLEKAGRSYKEIDAVFITHRHPDHFADLIPLVQALLATPNYKREKDLFIIAPEGFREYYNMTVESLLSGAALDFVRIVEIYNNLDLASFQISTVKTVHSEDSIAYRFEHNGKVIVFTGDADYDQGVIDLSKNTDLLIIDCSFPDGMKVKGHLCARECGLIAEKAGAKKLLLSHIYPADSPDIERVIESGNAFGGEIILAEDLMELEV
jgi:ribonuclease BN (tRNA processing enzyme)